MLREFGRETILHTLLCLPRRSLGVFIPFHVVIEEVWAMKFLAVLLLLGMNQVETSRSRQGVEDEIKTGTPHSPHVGG
jgi:hypothetical protein